MYREIRLFQIDSFAARPFEGNPAAVCLLDGSADAAWMQQVAAEMNLSETAFVSPAADGFELRWFTPTVEVDLCGHATLASAHVLFETGTVTADASVRFHTRSGLLTVARSGDGYEMDFPADPPAPCAAPDGLARVLGAEPVSVLRGREDLVIRLADAATVRGLTPDMAALGRLDARGVIVTAAADEAGCDFISRFFGPQVGIDEDPVTGSAHCTLAPYWAAELDRDRLRAYQASARGGWLSLTVTGARVQIGGQAVTVFSGVLHA
ncbi:hypothetical protein BI364_16610 [Acidihalobacter yilgarnensis]|uniref:Oxidoreductase n=1 Tax=Acidihalobacter yilgarnensis TaxID=2819280 RepID=A0A1D8ISL0_9GAMM|nr:PhzF family phenazine biosynthesis protein [Acidihalobacter yilgarnensis]AOU99334.1 hypothetical protein BI364_16610 [Acidihalobacter yilgarnensis]